MVPVTGSIAARVPDLSTISHTLPAPVVIPPSAAAGPTANTAVTRLAARSTFARDGTAVHIGTHSLRSPAARPAHGSPGSATLATTLLVIGSIRCTAWGPVLPTQTAPGAIATQSAVLPTWTVAAGVGSRSDVGGGETTPAGVGAAPDEQIQIARTVAAASMPRRRQRPIAV